MSTIWSPDAVFPLQTGTVFYPMFAEVAPFLVAIPFAASFLVDRDIHMLSALQSRSGVKNYYIGKAASCFIGGFLVFFIPLLISMALNGLTFPQSGKTFFGDLFDINYSASISGNNVFVSTEQTGILFTNLYLFNAHLYNLLFAVIFSFAMGIFGTFDFAVSFFMKKYKVLLLVPLFLIIVLCNMSDLIFSGNDPYVCYKPMVYLTVNTHYGKNPVFIFSLLLVLAGISFLLLYRQIKKDQLD